MNWVTDSILKSLTITNTSLFSPSFPCSSSLYTQKRVDISWRIHSTIKCKVLSVTFLAGTGGIYRSTLLAPATPIGCVVANTTSQALHSQYIRAIRINRMHDLKVNGASCWFLLHRYIAMHVPQSIKSQCPFYRKLVEPHGWSGRASKK
jgi:hypothetical protein